jgi:hypothetical protein
MKRDETDYVGVMPRDARDIAADRLKRDNRLGKALFMVCGCQTRELSPAGFVPIVVHEDGDVILKSLVCLECGTPGYFVGGRLILSEDDLDDELEDEL